MSENLKAIETSAMSPEESNCPNPNIQTNLESRHHNNVMSQELQAEQFIACTAPVKPKVVYGNPSANGNDSLREATMSLYNSLNASDHI